MKLLIFLSIALIAFLIPLIALRLGREWLIALLPIYLITGNVFAESFLTIWGQLTSLAIPVYAGTFLVTDTLSEHFGESEAKRAVFVGILGQLVLVAMMLTVTHAPIIDEYAVKFETTFALIPRLVGGSIVAYLVSQFWDIKVFHWIKAKTGPDNLWLRNLVSTISSQFLDTAVFLFIGFWGVLPEFWSFLLTTWLFKVLVAAIDTPYLYASRWVIGLPLRAKARN